MKYTKEEVNRARDIPIHTLYGQTAGRRLTVCCPFHGEKTPSCVFYPDNSWHCFGCGSHGKGAIDFVMELMDYKDSEVYKAIEELLEDYS